MGSTVILMPAIHILTVPRLRPREVKSKYTKGVSPSRGRSGSRRKIKKQKTCSKRENTSDSYKHWRWLDGRSRLTEVHAEAKASFTLTLAKSKMITPAKSDSLNEETAELQAHGGGGGGEGGGLKA